ncbi:MAG: M90 family metallopeptidase [Comamonas sp.]
MSWRAFLGGLRSRLAPLPQIDSTLWLAALQPYPFLAALPLADQAKLRTLAALFLQRKQFHGAHGLVVTDAMALQIAAQACLPLLHWGAPREALAWYGDFVGIVVHPGEAVARREAVDDAGVVHHYQEVLLGEAMEGGPVMLSWQAVDDSRHSTAAGTSVVIHEFAHKIDMRGGAADGCPPLPPGFLGSASARAARALWHAAWQPAYERFREQVIIAERFGGAQPWLDSYGATAPAEFFAVACEAWFVNRTQFALEFPTLAPQLAAFFGPDTTP